MAFGNGNCTTSGLMGFCVKSLKYILFGFCLSFIVSMKALGAGPVEVEGAVKADTAWAGDVLVVGDVLVPEGVTLTVAPGTKVMFAASESSKIEPAYLSMQTEIVVRGRLVAEGREDAMITFGPAPEELNTKRPGRGDWGGIIFDGPGSGASSISNARFTMADAALGMYGSSPTVAGCIIEDCRYGVVAAAGARPRLVSCIVTGGEFGVVSARGAKPLLEKCAVEKNERDFITGG